MSIFDLHAISAAIVTIIQNTTKCPGDGMGSRVPGGNEHRSMAVVGAVEAPTVGGFRALAGKVYGGYREVIGLIDLDAVVYFYYYHASIAGLTINACQHGISTHLYAGSNLRLPGSSADSSGDAITAAAIIVFLTARNDKKK